MVEPAWDRMYNNISKAFDRTRVGRKLAKFTYAYFSPLR
jgi:hypothetical protein